MRIKRLAAPLFLVLVLVFLSSCNPKPPAGDTSIPDHRLTPVYAKGFSIDYYAHYKRIVLYNPWGGDSILATYYLTSDSLAKMPSDGIVVITPVRSLVSASCTHYTFLQMLDELSSVCGVCDVKRSYNAFIRKGFADGSIADLGDPFRMNVERCLMLNPDLVMISGFNQHDENASRLMAAGIPVVMNNEWMEDDLLGRAEWIKFMAAFYNKEVLADSLFTVTEQAYLSLKAMVKTAKAKKPLILSGDNFRGTWYQPGGRSYTARLFEEAGGQYLYSKDSSRGSIPMSFEKVFKDLKEADVWVGATNGATLHDLSALDPRYRLFNAFKKGRVYAYTNRTTVAGGNDFWESAVARPDSLLADFMYLFHPELLPGHQWVYLKQLH